MVLIVGAGPVGLTLAVALARLRVPVRIIDRSDARTEESRALVVWPRTMELLDIEADGLVDRFVAAGTMGAGARIHAEGRELVALSFSLARSRFPFALLIPQGETERLLEARLATLGVTVERSTSLVAFASGVDGVTATLRLPTGEAQVVTCAYLAGCDGASSPVRHGLALEFVGVAREGTWLLADVALSGDVPPHEVVLTWARDGVFVTIPIRDKRFRVLADTPAAGHDAAPALAEVQALIDARAPTPLVASDPVWASRFRINERQVREYRRGRVFLAGDAAHIHSPAGGQGMNTGMQDAFNLAWKLALVLGGTARPELLDTYSTERSRVARLVLRDTGHLTALATARNPLLRMLRTLVAMTLGDVDLVRQRMVDRLTELDVGYPGSALTQETHGAGADPAPGTRAVDVPVRDARGEPTRLHALLRTGRFVLLASTGSLPTIPAGLHSLVDAATTIDAGYAPGHVFLVRPDAYVSACAPLAHADRALAVAARISGS